MFSTSYTVYELYYYSFSTNYNIRQVFFTIIYLEQFVLAVVDVLPRPTYLSSLILTVTLNLTEILTYTIAYRSGDGCETH
jgi:hypothetical protein